MNTHTPRPPLTVTLAVWKALFFREAHIRLFGARAAWAWLLFDPVVQTAFLTAMIGRALSQVTFGVDGAMFVMTGLLGYHMFQHAATKCMEAIDANKALFSYRQVKPVDTVIVRALMEGAVESAVAIILLSLAVLIGFEVIPFDPLLVAVAFGILFSMGTGLGLIISVIATLIPESKHIINILLRPLYFLSGIMFPANIVPQPYRDWLMTNPLLHGVEMLRMGFFGTYKAVPEATLAYPAMIAIGATFFGLALQVRFANRLMAL